jgi:hypothetical protein
MRFDLSDDEWAFLEPLMPKSRKSARPPTSYARHRADGTWCVSVTWQNGRREEIGRYKSAAEAEEFIKQQLQAWHDGHNAMERKVQPPTGGKVGRARRQLPW